ncbi:helix-turn-helix domain-containing protein [Nonomuraea sp. CA-141351]|uniref:helix-turn-helix domain-containing protein n=1 Tax=Nonomuraea sp. CA-141351 TaxID=3239996 RepID=UPI003D8DDB20
MDESTTSDIDPGVDAEPSADQVLLTPEQAAALLNLNPLFLKRQARAGRFPHWRTGKLYRFTREHIAEIARLGSRTATTAAGRAPGRRSR